MLSALAQDAGLTFTDVHTEFIGLNSLMGAPIDEAAAAEATEVYLRMAVRAREKRTADAFTRLFPFLGLSGPPFIAGFHGVEPARELIAIWPALIGRAHVEPHVITQMTEV
jgi:hypothetical protein